MVHINQDGHKSIFTPVLDYNMVNNTWVETVKLGLDRVFIFSKFRSACKKKIKINKGKSFK